MKLIEQQNEQLLDFFVDLLEPISEIFTDKDIYSAYKASAPWLKLLQMAIKNHKRAIIQILAVWDGIPEEEYKVNIITIPVKAKEIYDYVKNTPEIMDFFQ